MLGQSWKELVAHIPPEARDGLGLITASNVEINIQSVMRLEEEYLVIRGRLTGSLDAGRTFFVPYDQINCLVFQRFLKENEVQAWFGPAAAVAETTPAGEAAAADGAEAAATEQELATAAQTGPAPLPGKAAILERLRKRTGSAPGTVKKPLGSAPGTTPRPGLGNSAQGTTPRPPLGPAPRPAPGAPGQTPPRPPQGGAGPGNPPPKPPEK